MSFMTVGRVPWALYDAAISGKRIDIEFGSASSTIGPEQAFYIGHRLSKVRFAPNDAHDFFTGLDALVRGIRSGRLTEGSYFSGAILDFAGDVSLDVDFGVASGKLYFRLGDEEIEIRPDDLDRLNEACREFHPLARAGRRGTGRSAALIARYRDQARRQAIRDQNHPSRSQVEAYGDWIDQKIREY
jgi:hypothetical protein